MAGHPLCGARPGQGTWFLAVALLSLALEIGANTTIFSVLHAVLYRLLPYQHSDRWMVVWQSSPGLEQPPPVAETVDWKRLNQAFEDLALTSRGEQGSFSGTGGPSSSTNRTSPRISFVC